MAVWIWTAAIVLFFAYGLFAFSLPGLVTQGVTIAELAIGFAPMALALVAAGGFWAMRWWGPAVGIAMAGIMLIVSPSLWREILAPAAIMFGPMLVIGAVYRQRFKLW